MNFAWRWTSDGCRSVDQFAVALREMRLDFVHFRGLFFGNAFFGLVRARKATTPEQATAVMESFGPPEPPNGSKVRK